jgi:dephospho-CoA kinase
MPPPPAVRSETSPEARLDAEAVATCQRLAGLLFPWDITRALELALLKTFCLPSISGLLSSTGEFEQRPRKRYDDTGLMVAELLRHGPDSAVGTAVLARLNRIHGHYAISNDDFLYVLSSFVAEPIRWLQHYGWRPLSSGEQQALFRFWQRVGARMGIRELPQTLDALLALNSTVENQRFRAAASNQRVAEATLAMLINDWPGPLRPALRRLLRGLLPPEVTRSLCWPAAPGWLRLLLRATLRGRSALANGWQRLRPPRHSRFFSEAPTPSYGARFRLEQLGPPAQLARLNSPRWSGPQRRIGLTGGIASGKSSVAALLAGQGLPVLDADVHAREALAPGSAGARAVVARYGERVVAGPDRARARQAGPPGQEGSADAEPSVVLDRAALGRIVFSDPAERRWLEGLVHPIVRQRFAAELERLAAAPVVVLVIPLLFETGLETLCSEVWLVDCDADEQRRRLIERDRLSGAEARARIAAQWPLERKRPLADRLIDNRGAPDRLADQVAAALSAAAAPPTAAVPPA